MKCIWSHAFVVGLVDQTHLFLFRGVGWNDDRNKFWEEPG